MRLFRAISLATFSLLVVVIGGAAGDDLTTTSGKTIKGKLVAVDAQGVTFRTSDAEVKVPGRDIVLIDLGNKVAPAAAKYHEIELTDGSTLRVSKLALKGKTFETELLPGPAGVAPPAFELPMTALFCVLRGADDPKNREAWKKVLGARGKRDMYVVREADGLNFIQGTVLAGSDDGKTFDFELENGKKADPPLLQSRATGGLVFHQPPPAQVRQAVCKVLDVFGNALVAEAVELSPSGVKVTTVSGVTLKYQNPSAIAQLDFARGNIAYLSDLEPQVDAPAVPPDEKGLRLNVVAPFIRDQGVAGEPLRLGSETFAKGLLIAPDTALTFNVGGDYREFRAIVGLPENILDANLQAKVTIEADQRVLFSEYVRRKEKPKSLTLDIKGVKQLRVSVEADLPVNGNRVILGEGRLQK